MNFLIHENLPKLDQYLQGHGHIETFSGRTPPAHALKKADVLLIRSVTQVTPELLALAPQLQFVGTGTIGTEHVDQAALDAREIGFASAPGTNAISVGEYVLAAVLELAHQAQLTLKGKEALVVGAGHTGTQAGKRFAALGMEVKYIDPAPVLPKGHKVFTDWSALSSADVISFHVPLTTSGKHATHHLMAAAQLSRLKPNVILINASRGAVIDNLALVERIKKGPALYCALDVWEGEPSVNPALVDLVQLATPHIAGHSQEGKIRGSHLLYEALCNYFGWSEKRIEESFYMPPRKQQTFVVADLKSGEVPQSELTAWVQQSYPINEDDRLFREHGLTPEGFDQLRKNYQHRRELSASCVKVSKAHLKQCQQLGFEVELAAE